MVYAAKENTRELHHIYASLFLFNGETLSQICPRSTMIETPQAFSKNNEAKLPPVNRLLIARYLITQA